VVTREIDRLAELVLGAAVKPIGALSHYVTEPAAKKLGRNRSGTAARLWRSQGMRIMDARKSKYYDAALTDFERARDCYVRADLALEWELTARQVCAAHFLKSGFIGEFQKLAAGAISGERPSFLDLAKQRWDKRREP
jgi:hypothetical protein